MNGSATERFEHFSCVCVCEADKAVAVSCVTVCLILDPEKCHIIKKKYIVWIYFAFPSEMYKKTKTNASLASC